MDWFKNKYKVIEIHPVRCSNLMPTNIWNVLLKTTLLLNLNPFLHSQTRFLRRTYLIYVRFWTRFLRIPLRASYFYQFLFSNDVGHMPIYFLNEHYNSFNNKWLEIIGIIWKSSWKGTEFFYWIILNLCTIVESR